MKESIDVEKFIHFIIGFANLVMVNLSFTLINMPIIIWLALTENKLLSPAILPLFLLTLTVPFGLIAVFSCVKEMLYNGDHYSFKQFFPMLKSSLRRENLPTLILWYVLLMAVALYLMPVLSWVSLFSGAYVVIALYVLLMIPFAIVESLTFKNSMSQTLVNSFLSVLLNWRISLCLVTYLIFAQFLSQQVAAAPFFLLITLFAFSFLFMYRPKLQKRIQEAK